MVIVIADVLFTTEQYGMCSGKLALRGPDMFIWKRIKILKTHSVRKVLCYQFVK